MTCPVCSGKTKVEMCRKDCDSVVRRRKCLECRFAFYTQETECSNQVYNDMVREQKKKGKK